MRWPSLMAVSSGHPSSNVDAVYSRAMKASAASKSSQKAMFSRWSAICRVTATAGSRAKSQYHKDGRKRRKPRKGKGGMV